MFEYTLWPHQERLIEGIKQSIRNGNKRIVAYLGTGGGKSLCMAHITKTALAKNKKVCFVVNRKLLTDQFGSTLTKMGIKFDTVQGENTFITGLPVQVATIQTIARRGFFDADVILIDEGHFAPGSKDYRNFIFANKNKIIVAFSATPFSKGMGAAFDELDGEPLFQDIVIGGTISDLIESGTLVDLDIFAPSEPDMEGCKTSRNSLGERDYQHKDAEGRVNNVKLIGSVVEHWKRYADNKKTFGFAHSINHSKALATAFLEAGIKADHIDGWHTEEERDEILSKFKSGETRVLFNSQILREGVDIPDAEVLILAKPTKSLISYIQMVGRILRSFPGKKKALMLDHSGSAWQMPFIDEDLPLVLDTGENNETQSKQREKKEKEDVICVKCKAVKKTLICPNCGFESIPKHSVKEKDGELVKLTKSQKIAQDKENLYSQLKDLATRRGWLGKKLDGYFREITGSWPTRSMRFIPAKKASKEVEGLITHVNIKRSKSQWRKA